MPIPRDQALKSVACNKHLSFQIKHHTANWHVNWSKFSKCGSWLVTTDEFFFMDIGADSLGTTNELKFANILNFLFCLH